MKTVSIVHADHPPSKSWGDFRRTSWHEAHGLTTADATGDPDEIVFREVLTADRTYYVRTDGSDNNNGLTDTAAGAFATFNKALDAIAQIDGGGFDVTIQGNNATHTDLLHTTKAFVGIGSLFIDCAGGTISTTGVTALVFSTAPPFGIYYSNVTLTSTGFECNAVSIGSDMYVQQNEGVVYGSVGDVHIDIEGPGTFFWANDDYTITGGGNHHIYVATAGSHVHYNTQTITLTGTPDFATAFVQIYGLSLAEMPGLTFVGGATGKRYWVRENGNIQISAGGDPNYFPGDVAGVAESGGNYDGITSFTELMVNGSGQTVAKPNPTHPMALIGSTTDCVQGFWAYGAAGAAATISMNYTPSNTSPTTHQAVQQGYWLGLWGCNGSTGVDFAEGARIIMAADDDFSAGSSPGRIELCTVQSGSVNYLKRAILDSKGNVVINTAAIATNASDGFLYVPTCAGTPTGTPTTYAGRAPIVVNTTNNKLYFYSGGAWRDAGP